MRIASNTKWRENEQRITDCIFELFDLIDVSKWLFSLLSLQHFLLLFLSISSNVHMGIVLNYREVKLSKNFIHR